MTPVRQAQKLVHSAVHGTLSTAWYAARHPVSGAARVVGLARGAVDVAKAAPGIVADTVATKTQGGPPPTTADPGSESGTPPEVRSPGTSRRTTGADSPSAKARQAGGAKKKPTEAERPGPLKTTVPDPSDPTAPPEPGQAGVPDLEPPDPADRVLVVEEALAAEAAEAEDGSRFGVVTEPHASSRDEDHGEAPLRRAERDEVAEEAAARE